MVAFAGTDEEGRFEVRPLRGGEQYRFMIRRLDGAIYRGPYRETSVKTEPAGSNSTASVTLVVDRIESAHVAGRVIWDTGEGVPYVAVSATPKYDSGLQDVLAVTDQAGGFVLEDLARDRDYELVVEDPARSGVEGRTDARAGGPPVTMTLQSPGAIEGRLVGFPESMGVLACAVGGRCYHLRVDAGTFNVHLPAGSYLVFCADENGGDAVPVRLEPGQVRQVLLRSLGSGRVEGRVQGSDGRPVANAMCVWRLSVEEADDGWPPPA